VAPASGAPRGTFTNRVALCVCNTRLVRYSFINTFSVLSRATDLLSLCLSSQPHPGWFPLSVGSRSSFLMLVLVLVAGGGSGARAPMRPGPQEVGLLPSEGVLTHPRCQQPTRISTKAGTTVGTRISRKAEEGYLPADSTAQPRMREEPGLLWYVPGLGAYVILYLSSQNSSTVQTYELKLVRAIQMAVYQLPAFVRQKSEKIRFSSSAGKLPFLSLIATTPCRCNQRSA
jgi:hypothetical protein